MASGSSRGLESWLGDEDDAASVSEEESGSNYARPPVILPVTATIPTQTVPSITMDGPIRLNDDELFSTDDNMVRRIIYGDCTTVPAHRYKDKDVARIICLNFTKQHFEPGATKWHHLKDHYYELLASVFNSLAFATGKKMKLTASEKAVRQKQRAPRRGKKGDAGDDEDDLLDDLAAPIEASPEIELNNFLQCNKDITVFLETLVTGNRVSGFRWWIFDRSLSKTENDALSLGLRESLLEASKIQDQANKQLLAIAKNNSGARGAKSKKAASAKQYDVTKEFAFSNYASFDRHFTGLVMRYFAKDGCLTVSENQAANNKASIARRRQFRDTRAYTKHDTVLQQDAQSSDYTKIGHPCNLSVLFAKEAAMFYYVNEESINEAQCRLESYFASANGGRLTRAKESAHCQVDFLDGDVMMQQQQHEQDEQEGEREEEEGEGPVLRATNKASGPPMVDVADYSQAAKDNAFTKFPYESITYHLDNTFLSHEFISRMPLPHRIGATLYTQKDMVSLKKRAGLPVDPVEEANGDIEEVEVEVEVDKLDKLERFLEDLVISEQSGIEGNNIYGTTNGNRVRYNAVVCYMGLHQTELELNSDVLLSQLHHIDFTTQSYLRLANIPRDILDKFLANKRNEINSRLKLILTNLGPRNRSVVSETMAATVAAQEDTRRKSLSACILTPGQAKADGRDQTVNVMDQISHGTRVDENDSDLLQLPYVSFSTPGFLDNSNKQRVIQRKALEYVRRSRATPEHEDGDGVAFDPVIREEQRLYEEKEYQAKVASGKVAYFKDEIEQYRPFGNSLYTLKTQLHGMETEEVFLGRDIFLRLGELNHVAFAQLKIKYYDPVTGMVPSDREEAYQRARKKLIDALVVECWHEFFENRNVSLACEGIRSDLLKQKLSYAPPDSTNPNGGSVSSSNTTDYITGRRIVGTQLPVHEFRQEVRPYSEFRIWVQSLFADQFGIAYNYKIMFILWMASKHHCRWYPYCNSPKLNVILSGTGMAGKSHMLQAVKQILPTGVGDMVTHITDQAFNTDRNMNDMLLIYEEFQNKYLGYASGGGSGGKNDGDGSGSGGTSAGSDKDTTNFFKARLTSGATTTMSWFENEETGMRDMKISKSHCQGNIIGASNNNFTGADVNVMTRFILLSVPKSKSQHEGHRPQDKAKFIFGSDNSQNNAIYEQHKELHRVYYMMEQMIKSRVIEDNVYGVNVDGGRILIDMILDHLQKRYGISTGDVRKRNHILELARTMALSYAVWMGLMSPLTRYLQYDPHDPTKFIGLNPRVLMEGIMPFMVITKDMVFDAITSLSSLWYHDYQDDILAAFATQHCHLHEIREDDFLVRSKTDNFFLNMNAATQGGTNTNAKKKRAMSLGASGSSSTTTTPSSLSTSGVNLNPSAFGSAYANNGVPQDEKETDYNYVVMRGKSLEAIYQSLSMSLGDMVVSHNDISKLFHDLSKCQLENCDGYEMASVPDQVDELTAEVTSYRPKLVRAAERKTMSRPIVEYTRCPSGKQVVAVLVHFLKQKLPAILSDNMIEDLNKNERRARLITPEEFYDQETMKKRNAQNAMEIDERDARLASMHAAANDYEEKVRRIGKIGATNETLIIKAIKDIMENPVLENVGMDEDEQRLLEESYMNPSTQQVPWHTYITADCPKPAKITQFFPDLKEALDKTDDGDAPILFVDELQMLDLKPRTNGRKIVIRNHNTVAPSVRATLSIYKDRKKQLVKRIHEDGTEVQVLGPGEVLKRARIHEYGKTEAFEVDRDIDGIFCGEHNRNIAFQALESKPLYEMINYPPCTYMALMEDKHKEEGIEGALLEYPHANNMVRLANRKKYVEGQIHPTRVQHKKLSELLLSDYEQDGRARLRASTNSGTLKIGRPVRNRCLATERRQREALIQEYL